jgi:hypothetical protein
MHPRRISGLYGVVSIQVSASVFSSKVRFAPAKPSDGTLNSLADGHARHTYSLERRALASPSKDLVIAYRRLLNSGLETAALMRS